LRQTTPEGRDDVDRRNRALRGNKEDVLFGGAKFCFAESKNVEPILVGNGLRINCLPSYNGKVHLTSFREKEVTKPDIFYVEVAQDEKTGYNVLGGKRGKR